MPDDGSNTPPRPRGAHAASAPAKWGRRESWVRSICWQRVPLLGAAVLILFPLAAVSIASPMLRNLFEIGPLGMALIAPMAIICAWLCTLCARIAGTYAAARSVELDILLPAPPPALWARWLFFSTAFAFPALGLAAWETDRTWSVIGAGLAVVVVVGAIPWLVRNKVDDYLFWADKRTRWLAGWLATRAPAFRDGYVGHDDDGVPFIFPGHILATTLVCAFGALYLAGMVIFRPGRPWLPPPTALAYLLLLHGLLVVVLSGMAFFLDRFRLPLLVMVLALSIFAIGTRNPYFFAMHPVPAGAVAALPSPNTPFARYMPAPGSPWEHTAVVVCASGGGIQSAAWTASVLTWLQDDPRLGPGFTRATRFYSGVSGGSVGIMYFLAAFDPAIGAPPADRLQTIRDVASRSSISEVAWGIVYPDMGRTLLPGSWSADVNRAWALEQAWRALPRDGPKGYGRKFLDDRWSDWVQAVRDGRLPGVAFNAFDIVSGNRILFANVSIPESAESAVDIAALAGDTDLLDVDVDVVTAARLSATFPYVTPISRPKVVGPGKFDLPEVAVADGGYFDNAGIMTAIEWIRSLRPDGLPAWLDRIVVVEIRAFEREGEGRARQRPASAQQMTDQRKDDAPPKKDERPSYLPKSWTDAVVGPIEGLLKTRTSTQIARNDLDVKLLTEVSSSQQHPLRIERVVFEPQGEKWPLSWHLSSGDIEKLKKQRTKAFDPTKEDLVTLLGLR